MATRKALEKEFRAQVLDKERNFGRILFHLKRQFDDWAVKKYASEGYPDIKIGHIPFLMNIGIEGITNQALAEHLMVSKQAMSKTIRELESLGYIKIDKHPADGRSQLIILSDKGLELVVTSKKRICKLVDLYRKKMSGESYEKMIDGLLMVIDIHLALKE